MIDISSFFRPKSRTPKSRSDGIVVPAYHPFMPGFKDKPLLAICCGAPQDDLTLAANEAIDAAIEILHLLLDRQMEHQNAFAGVIILLELSQEMHQARLFSDVPNTAFSA